MSNAKLRFCYGTMASGKSLQLLTIAYNFEQRNIPILVLKSEIDTRDGGDIIKSRIGNGIERNCTSISSDTNIYNYVLELNDRPKWILIDEAQFLTPEQVNQLGDIVDYLEIDIWCFGLRTDFKTNLFPGSKRLFEIADKIEELKSSCGCGRKNIVNARITRDGNIAIAGTSIEVGGDERYTAICRKCYKEKLKKDNENGRE